MFSDFRVENSVCKEVWVTKAHKFFFLVAGRRRSGIQCSSPYISSKYTAFSTSSWSPFLLQQETERAQNIFGLVLKAIRQLQQWTAPFAVVTLLSDVCCIAESIQSLLAGLLFIEMGWSHQTIAEKQLGHRKHTCHYQPLLSNISLGAHGLNDS